MEKMVEMESVALHWFRKLDLLSSFFPRCGCREMGRQAAGSTMNGYLFCLVCFSICMNISHKLFIFNL